MESPLTPTCSPDVALRSLVRDELKLAADRLTGTDAIDQRVHDARKALKRLRAVLRLARVALPERTFRRENVAYRDAARALATAREAAALKEALERLAKEGAEEVREVAKKAAALVADQPGAEPTQEELDAIAADLRSALARVDGWVLDAGWEPLLRGMRETYAAGRKRFARAVEELDSDSFHEWRKQVKYHWTQVAVLEPCWEKALSSRRSELKRLSELLGDEHDLAELNHGLARLALEPAERKLLETALREERRRLQQHALELGARLYAERPKALAERIGRYVDAWRSGLANAG